MVRSQNFKLHQYIGDPIAHVKRMMDWNVDELIILDIDEKEFSFQQPRMDHKTNFIKNMQDFTKLVSEVCRIPLSLGGKIRSYEDIKIRIRNGADKVIVNYLLKSDHEIIKSAIKSFGSQAIVASIDYKIINNEAIVFIARGTINTNIKLLDWSFFAQECGVGEILLNSIDLDGSALGYDLENIKKVSENLDIPVIACSLAGCPHTCASIGRST